MSKNKKPNLVKLVCTNCGAETQKRKNGMFSNNDLTCTKCFKINGLIEKIKK